MFSCHKFGVSSIYTNIVLSNSSVSKQDPSPVRKEPETIKEPSDLEEPKFYVDKFMNHRYGSKWSLPTIAQIHAINSEFENSFGIAKFKAKLEKNFHEKAPARMQVVIEMYDDYYINQNTKLTTSFNVHDENVTVFTLENQEILVENGHTFTTSYEYLMKANLTLNFMEEEKDQDKAVMMKLIPVRHPDTVLEIMFDGSAGAHPSPIYIFIYSSVLT
jgi:hypothetical protein